MTLEGEPVGVILESVRPAASNSARYSASVPSTVEEAVKASEGQASEEAGAPQQKVSSAINSRSGSSLPSKT